MNRLVGLLLIVAAGLKAREIFHNPAAFFQVEFGQTIIPFVIAGELGIGLLALFGLYWRQVRWIAIACCMGFAGYSLSLALQGAESCGCFGPVKVNPWWTLLLDIGVVAGLVVEWWWERRIPPSPSLSPGFGGEGQLENPSPNLSPVPARREGEKLMKLAGIGGLCLALFLVLVWLTRPIVHADGLLQTVSGLTILEPADWSGQPFPLTESIDVDLSQGEWLVVLHRHDCHDCQEAVPLYEELAVSDAGKRVALVEVPPYGEDSAAGGSACVLGRLTTEHEWFVQTPVEIRLREGIVQSASTELPAIEGLEKYPARTVAFQE